MKESPWCHAVFRPIILLILALSFFLVPPGSIPADEKTQDVPADPIQIISDDAVFDPNNNKAVFRGNAHAVQGQTNVTADQITIELADSKKKPAETDSHGFDDVEKIVAEGHVRIVFDQYIAVSEKVIYLSAERKLILSGPGSKITSDKEEIIANEITYYRDSGRIDFTGSKNDQVKATVRTNERVLN